MAILKVRDDVAILRVSKDVRVQRKRVTCLY